MRLFEPPESESNRIAREKFEYERDFARDVRDSTPRAKVFVSGETQNEMGPRDRISYEKSVDKILRDFGFTPMWIPDIAYERGHEPPLRAWRAIDRNDETRQIWSDGRGLFSASQEDEASLTAMICALEAAGYKSATLSGSDIAIAKMTELCRARGIKVLNPLPDIEGMGTPPVPPPQPLTAAPKPRKTKKEIERINLTIARESWPQPDYRLPALKPHSRQQGVELPGREPHELARSAAAFDHVDFVVKASQMQISSRLLSAGISRTTFHLLREQDFTLDRIHVDSLHSANRQEDGPPKLDPKLCKALRKSAEQTGVPLPPELDMAITKAEAEHALAKEQKEQLDKSNEQSETKEVRIELEPH